MTTYDTPYLVGTLHEVVQQMETRERPVKASDYIVLSQSNTELQRRIAVEALGDDVNCNEQIQIAVAWTHVTRRLSHVLSWRQRELFLSACQSRPGTTLSADMCLLGVDH